jgi:hypothetical protein
VRKTICIVIALAIAAGAATAAQGQQPSPIQRIIAQEDAKRVTVLRRQQRADTPVADNTIPGPGNPNPNPGGLGDHPRNPIQVGRETPVTHGTVPASVVVTVDDGGFDWGDAGIGGAAGAALAILGIGGLVLVRDGRRQKAHG